LGLKYYYQLCPAAEDLADPHTANLVVDAKEMEANLTRLLES
jgi:hypothetical protein